MKLLDARVNGVPLWSGHPPSCHVSTKRGEKAVLDVATSEGNFTIWRPAGDMEVMGRRNGERVTIALDSKGKASLIDHASNSPAVARAFGGKLPPETSLGLVPTPSPSLSLPFEAEMKLKQQMGFQTQAQPSRSIEIADYIDRLGKLYNHCCAT